MNSIHVEQLRPPIALRPKVALMEELFETQRMRLKNEASRSCHGQKRIESTISRLEQ